MNDAIATLVRRHDPDRFLTALFAPSGQRDSLLTLYAFNHELARAREVASEPPLALIRLQWWREVIEGADRRHEVATPLTQAIATGRLSPDLLLPLIEAREAEAYADFESLADWRTWLRAGAGGLAVAAAAALGDDAAAAALGSEVAGASRLAAAEIARPFGAAYGVAGLLRSSRFLAARQQCLLPSELLARHGLSREAFAQTVYSSDAASGAAARDVLTDVVSEGRAFLAEARGMAVPRRMMAAVLPAVLAARDLRRWPLVSMPRGLGDRLAVVAGGVGGRAFLPGRTR